jgi:hypothetical protein
MNRAKRRKDERERRARPTLASLGLARRPPRRVEAVARPARLSALDVGSWLFAVLVTLLVIGGLALERAVALAFGTATTGAVLDVTETRTLKGRKTDLLRVRFRDGAGTEHVGELAVDGELAKTMRERLHPSQSAAARLQDRLDADARVGDPLYHVEVRPGDAPTVELRYLSGAPQIAGLVDDGGYGATVLAIWAAIAALLGALMVAPRVHWRLVGRRRERALYELGEPVPMRDGPRKGRNHRLVAYDFGGRTYEHLVPSRVWRDAVELGGERYALVDPSKPEDFTLVREGAWRVVGRADEA